MKSKVIFGFIAVFVGVLLFSNSPTSAVSGDCYFSTGAGGGIVKGDGDCLVPGYGNYGVNDVLTGRSTSGSGFAIPAGIGEGADPKGSFINFIKGEFNNGSSHNKIGAAFIIQTMRGSRSWPSSSDVDDWAARINQPSVTISRPTMTFSTSFRTSWFDDRDEKMNTFFAYHSSQADVIIIEVKNNGNVAAQIEVACGNMLGETINVIPRLLNSWSMLTTTSVNSSSVLPGGTITWTHTVKNSGPNVTDTAVSYYYQNSTGFSDTNKGGNGTLPSGSSTTPVSFSSTYTVPASASAGTQFCRKTEASPGSKTGGVATSSACATVSSGTNPTVPTSNDCHPIQIAVLLKTYGAVYHVAPDGTDYSIPAITVPVTVSTPIKSWVVGPYDNPTIDATSDHTTGETYPVTFTETTKHVISYTDHYDTQGPEILDYSGHSYYPKKYDKASGIEILDYSGISYSPKQYERLYSETTTNYMDPISWSGSIGPCYNYALNANVGAAFNARVESGASVFINPVVESVPYYTYDNTPHTRSMNSEWQITKMVVEPNSQLNTVSSGVSGADPCSYFDPGGVANCSVQTSNSSTIFSTAGTPSVNTSSTYTAPDSLAGTKICFAFSVRMHAGWDRSSTDDQWSHSAFDPASNCVIIVKKPKVQIWGGNLWAGGNVVTSQSVKNGNIFGSWDEYGIFSAKMTTGMASGAAFAGISGLANTSSACPYSFLSFANVPAGGLSCTGATGSIGNYTISSRSLAEITASFPSGTAINVGAITPNNLVSGTYAVVGNLTLDTSTLDIGKSIIINATGKVTINGDQRYTNGPYTKISQLPQLVVIANEIDIAEDVTNVDAWLIAGSSINTCSSVVPGVSLTVNKCNKPLVVNGPVMTNKLYLHRTAGSGTGTASGDPAEVFNLRPDVYLWSAARASSNGRIQTVYSTELPPRF